MAKRKRISGTRMTSVVGGEYAKREQDGTWRIDVGAVSESMTAYLEEAKQNGKYSVAGLCLGLGITREMYALWRYGYVCANDLEDDDVVHNEALAECIAIGELHLQKFWEESDKSTSLHMKLLESTGVIGQKVSASMQPTFDLGLLKKYGR